MKILLSEKELQKTIENLAQTIFRAHSPFSEVILVGIQTRGVVLAERLKKQILQLKKDKKEIPLGVLDINLYRDDLSKHRIPIVKKTEIPVSIEGKGIILVDEVLYTGRTIRAALDALSDLGRPSFIQLAVLIDRGGRELPIQPDYVGKVHPIKSNEKISVMFRETDSDEKVTVVHGAF